MATFALPNANNKATANNTTTLTNTSGYAVYSDVSTAVPVAQQTPTGVPAGGIDTGIGYGEVVVQLPGYPINVGTST